MQPIRSVGSLPPVMATVAAVATTDPSDAPMPAGATSPLVLVVQLAGAKAPVKPMMLAAAGIEPNIASAAPLIAKRFFIWAPSHEGLQERVRKNLGPRLC